jgi:DNA-binding NarL/FixJ family response regulator
LSHAIETTRVLIVEDHQIVADGLAMLLSDDPSLTVVGVATSGADAVELARRHLPDVVIMDYRLPDQTGAEASTAIKQALPDTAVLFLSADETDDAMFAAVKSGAIGYLNKTEAGTKVVDSVHRAAAGEMLLPAWQLAKLITEREPEDSSPRDSDLTPRQADVLHLMAEGLGTKAIADRLSLKPSTAAWHVQTVLEKLDAHSRLEAVAHANQRGLLTR